MTRKKIILTSVAAILTAALCYTLWAALAAPTRIAFVNYQPIQLSQIAKANNSRFIRIHALSTEELHKAKGYDMVFVNGMGLRITDEERRALQDAADKGLPVLSTAVTNPQNMIVSTDSVDSEFLKQYLAGGGRANHRNLLRYVRRYIDGKRLFTGEISDPVIGASGLLYHPATGKRSEEDDVYFSSLADYEKYLSANGLLTDNQKSVILTGQMGEPTPVIAELEKRGLRVYAISNINMALKAGMLDSISPSAMINMAHGRLGDAMVSYLERADIPLFSPLNVNRDYQEWMDDKMGMNGGFMSQSIVTPEIDGAIFPFALFAQYEGVDGVPEVRAIPGRLEDFADCVENYIRLRSLPASEKKVAIYYFKGPGQSELVAEGMEVIPSLYALLTKMKAEGYKVDGLPASADALGALIREKGSIYSPSAAGSVKEFIKNGNPALIDAKTFAKWAEKDLDKAMSAEIEATDGAFPGHAPATENGELALARISLGNVVLIPQPAAGIGDDDFKIVHGTDMAPPYLYAAAYLWARNEFGADAFIHFGAHGSLEFTPRKQVALGSRDWSDRLIASTPHFYVYSTSNVGEAMMAKRRSYAGIINYLTPPFMESSVRGIYKELTDAISAYNREAESDHPDRRVMEAAARRVKKHTVDLGIHRELRLDSNRNSTYGADDIARIENFAEELANQKITGAHYVMGTPYSTPHITSTVMSMTVDPVAYSLFALDKKRGRVKGNAEPKGAHFTSAYLQPARSLIERTLDRGSEISDVDVASIAGVSVSELVKCRAMAEEAEASKDLFSKMMVMGSSMTPTAPTARLAERGKNAGQSKMKKMMQASGMSPEQAMAMARRMGADSAALARMQKAMKAKDPKRGAYAAAQKPESGMHHGSAPGYSAEELEYAAAVVEVDRALKNVARYREALASSPGAELSSVMKGLSGRYIAPTPGGDPVVNPMILPTGRNMFAVNAEETPSANAWEKGKSLVDNTLAMYKKAHGDSLPRKVSYTLWSSEFIETEGATIAQVLYMLGVEPVRDPFGRVTDLRLIPEAELGRPRIDVVVQTSGQLRDLAASRLFLISRAVEMAASAPAGKYPNFVSEGVMESERHLVDKGVTPKEARRLSKARVFGGADGNYGSGIQGMVEAGDRWEEASQIAETYLHNMGASYGSEEDWEAYEAFAFEAALTRTDVVVQPRQSNTWGALSLDHVYEFMGGMNLAVREVTGKEPDAYMADYRNRNHSRMQEVKEAIGVESRTTILNPAYIREKMKGGAGDAGSIADVIRNTYGWNVMKPDVIDNELWDGIYDTYVADVNNLGTKDFFRHTNPAALEELTAVMLETARKGMWKATDAQLEQLARLHTETVNEFGASGASFATDNSKLRDFISQKVDQAQAKSYAEKMSEMRGENLSDAEGMVLERDEQGAVERKTAVVNGAITAAVALICLIALILIIRRRRRDDMDSGLGIR